MYQPQSKQVIVFEDEKLFQLKSLNSSNNWIKLAKIIPWAELERYLYADLYISTLKKGTL